MGDTLNVCSPMVMFPPNRIRLLAWFERLLNVYEQVIEVMTEQSVAQKGGKACGKVDVESAIITVI